jgi:hypothetical protein
MAPSKDEKSKKAPVKGQGHMFLSKGPVFKLPPAGTKADPEAKHKFPNGHLLLCPYLLAGLCR